MSSFDNIFGPAPGRPNHPDFETLVDIILQLDGLTEDPDFNFAANVRRFVDPDSITYVALQRAVRLAKAVPESLRPVLVPQLAAMYLDGFMVGYRFNERSSG